MLKEEIDKQIRIEKSWHKKLKIHSAKMGVPITRLISQICEEYFKKNER